MLAYWGKGRNVFRGVRVWEVYVGRALSGLAGFWGGVFFFPPPNFFSRSMYESTWAGVCREYGGSDKIGKVGK